MHKLYTEVQGFLRPLFTVLTKLPHDFLSFIQKVYPITPEGRDGWSVSCYNSLSRPCFREPAFASGYQQTALRIEYKALRPNQDAQTMMPLLPPVLLLL